MITNIVLLLVQKLHKMSSCFYEPDLPSPGCLLPSSLVVFIFISLPSGLCPCVSSFFGCPCSLPMCLCTVITICHCSGLLFPPITLLYFLPNEYPLANSDSPRYLSPSSNPSLAPHQRQSLNELCSIPLCYPPSSQSMS